MKVKLKVVGGNHDGKELLINTKRFLIGRGEQCHLRPKSQSVSRTHCIIVIRDHVVLVQDLGSRNGTLVNGTLLNPSRAKILRHEDQLKVGKLNFQLLVEHGLAGAKKPEVKDVKDAALRTVAGASECRVEDIDISTWLDEADQIDRVRVNNDLSTRQLRVEDLSETTQNTSISDDDDTAGDDMTSSSSTSGSDNVSEKGKKRLPKQPPKKLPKQAIVNQHVDSRDAADDALKRLFRGQ